VMAGVYSSSDVVIDKPVWPDTRNIFVLYGILIPGKTSLTRTSGDSLSQTGYNPFGEHPSISNPLGNPPYPGWTTSAGPNWVSTLSIGHLTVGRLSHYRTQSFYRHGPRLCDKWVYRHILEGRSESTILPLRSQETVLCPMDEQRQHLLYHPKFNLVLIQVTWIGTNDIMKQLNTEYQLSLMFQLQDRLYNLGARNFVFFTVPPFDRTPWGTSCRSLYDHPARCSCGRHDRQNASRSGRAVQRSL